MNATHEQNGVHATHEQNGVHPTEVQHTIELHKTSKRHLNREKLKVQIGKIQQRAIAGNRGKHWSVEISNVKDWTVPNYING